jgi:hypothetical protein
MNGVEKRSEAIYLHHEQRNMKSTHLAEEYQQKKKDMEHGK